MLRTAASVLSVKFSVKQEQILQSENYLHKYNMVTKNIFESV